MSDPLVEQHFAVGTLVVQVEDADGVCCDLQTVDRLLQAPETNRRSNSATDNVGLRDTEILRHVNLPCAVCILSCNRNNIPVRPFAFSTLLLTTPCIVHNLANSLS